MEIIAQIHGLADAIQRDADRLISVNVNHVPATPFYESTIKVMVLISDYAHSEPTYHEIFEGDSSGKHEKTLEALRDDLATWLCERRKQLREAA
ncbi:hypothetical protein [Halomonas sp. hl-4]|uniref:hypothetical protein n=1 Tax=Halomonas sp. hl-4 TaxID=1761789 RepID=UPI000BB75D35|nr:hypothetical protein [Halomonas sp. hl-4]SNY95528.1 hypothetical protein SAMN04488142_0028 [Halomonas sp. hl-4]